jgi:hypothetical protein
MKLILPLIFAACVCAQITDADKIKSLEFELAAAKAEAIRWEKQNAVNLATLQAISQPSYVAAVAASNEAVAAAQVAQKLSDTVRAEMAKKCEGGALLDGKLECKPK